TLSRPQCINIPNLAACHHFIRRSRSARTSGLSLAGSPVLLILPCGGCSRLHPAGIVDIVTAVAPAPIILRYSRRDIPAVRIISLLARELYGTPEMLERHWFITNGQEMS